MTTTMTDPASVPASVPAPALPRGGRQAAAVVVAVLLLIVSGYVAWQAILVQQHSSTTPFSSAPVSDYLGRTAWNSTAVLIAGIVLAVLGLWMLLSAVVPPRRKLVELREVGTCTSTGIRRADLVRALNLAAEGVDGVASARTRLSRSTAKLTFSTPLGRPGSLQGRVNAVVQKRIDDLDPVEPLSLTVTLTSKDPT